MRIARLVVLSALAPVLASASAVDFDNAVDVAAALSAARSAAAQSAAPAMPKRRTERDCRLVTFRAQDGTVSQRFSLWSREWVDECWRDPRGGVVCQERPGPSWRRDVQLTLTERRPLLPWEYDAFEVCLDGPWLDIRQGESAYDYKLVAMRPDGFELQPERRRPMSPDPAGVLGELDARLALSLKDRWASYYAGERIVVKVELKRHVRFWPDVVVLAEKELELPVADSYSVPLTRFSGEFSEALEGGKEYYVRYSIKRLGAVSRPVFTRALETGKVSYAPAAVAGL